MKSDRLLTFTRNKYRTFRPILQIGVSYQSALLQLTLYQ